MTLPPLDSGERIGAPPSMPTAPRVREIPPALSTLVHGADEPAVISVAVGFALRETDSFAWADCADLKRSNGSTSHRILSRGSKLPPVVRVDESVLSSPRWTHEALNRMVVSESPGFEGPVESYLRMPELFQRLIAHTSDREGRAAILLANVDAIPASMRGRVLEPPGLHDAIHAQGVAFVATCQERPSPGMVRAFDCVIRVDVPSSGRWSDGCLSVEKGEVPQLRADPAPLWEAWRLLGFDPSLLPS